MNGCERGRAPVIRDVDGVAHDPPDGVLRVCGAEDLEPMTMSGWTMVLHYQEDSTSLVTESVPMMPPSQGGYQHPAQYMSQTKYFPVTETFFVLKRSRDRIIEELRADSELQQNELVRLRSQIEDREKKNLEYISKTIELTKECDRLREIVAEPKVAVESFGLAGWSDEVRRIYKTVHGVDCNVTVRCDGGKWSAQVFTGKQSDTVANKDTAEAAAEALLVAMRVILREHIDKKKAELEELSTMENVAAVAMVGDETVAREVSTTVTKAEERMPF